MPRVSVVIPTNRPADRLELCLSALAAQTFDPRQVEVRVVYNGAPRGPRPDPQRWPFDLIVDEIEPANIAAAKNRALDAATGDLLLLLNDDVIPQPEFIARHVASHEALDRRGMVLGASIWRTYADQTVFDEMIRLTPMVFFYENMKPHAWHSFRHAWNLNLSLRRDTLGDERFDARLGPFFYEDLELAYRLECRRGVRVWYEPSAAALHDHRYALDGYLEREERMGEAAVRLARCNPACFHAIYGADLDPAHFEYCRLFVTTEGRHEPQRLARMQRAVCRPAAALGSDAGDRLDQAMFLYDAHLPLKRLAFRRGLIRAAARSPSALALAG